MGKGIPPEIRSLRQRAEARIHARSEESREIPAEDVTVVLHELRTHQIELELQNEELRTAQADLVEARDRYQDLYDFAPVGYVTISTKGIILEANLTLAELLGTSRGDLINQPLSASVFDEDQDAYFLHRHSLVEPGQRGACQLRMGSPDRGLFWARLETVVKATDDGELSLRLTISDISERHHAEEKVAASLEEKKLLLREIHHRVKNNLQVIISLLRLQSGTISDPEVQAVFSRCADRVKAMAVVHEKLHGSDNLASISCLSFLEGLARAVARSHGVDPSAIEIDAGEVPLCLDSAIPLGLIITELISNALVHAFPNGRSGKITLSLHPEGERGDIKLVVSDNGIGLPETDVGPGAESLGMALINQLVKQLGGAMEINGDAGTSATIIFNPLRGEDRE